LKKDEVNPLSKNKVRPNYGRDVGGRPGAEVPSTAGEDTNILHQSGPPNKVEGGSGNLGSKSVVERKDSQTGWRQVARLGKGGPFLIIGERKHSVLLKPKKFKAGKGGKIKSTETKKREVNRTSTCLGGYHRNIPMTKAENKRIRCGKKGTLETL